MKIKTKKLSNDLRRKVIEKISSIIKQQDNISFAYIHGSFMANKPFRDIDIAVYVTDNNEADILEKELALESEFEEILGEFGISFPVDCRILNKAPISFSYSVIKKGSLVFDADPRARSLFEEKIYGHYFDFLPYRKQYMKEVYGLS